MRCTSKINRAEEREEFSKDFMSMLSWSNTPLCVVFFFYNWPAVDESVRKETSKASLNPY